MTLRVLAFALALAPVAAQAQIVAGQVVEGEPPRSDPPVAVIVAQPDTYGPRTYDEMRETRRTIEQGRDAGLLTRQQAKGLRKESRRIDALAARYASDGLTYSEARELDMRARALDSIAGAQRGRTDVR